MSRVLVADSGSSKTAWAMAAQGEVMTTHGLNPLLTADEAFHAIVALVEEHFGRVDEVHFYGAGCGSDERKHRVSALLAEHFPSSAILVYTDLLGACRVAREAEVSMIGILGTGSNACLYSRGCITMQVASTGYVIGDHGSGNHVGRKLLQAYLASLPDPAGAPPRVLPLQPMPAEVRESLRAILPQSEAAVLDAVYRKPNANRFLASLAQVAVQYLRHPYCEALVREAIEDWLHHQVLPIAEASGCRTLSVVGGFGAAIKPLLSEVCSRHKIELIQAVASPIEAIRAYHA